MNFPLVYAEIDLGAIAHNIQELRNCTHPNAKVMAVVKANGYGHGSIQVAQTAIKNGADFLGVARIDEAIELRKAGLTEPILIFGYTRADQAGDLARYNLTQSISSRESAERLSAHGKKYGAQIKIHLKIDTGMGRVGLPAHSDHKKGSDSARIQAAVQTIESIAKLPSLQVEGIFTHFASADSVDKTYANLQFERFLTILDAVRTKGIDIPLRHAANSAALIHMPETHLDMVRPGISIYGLQPSTEIENDHIVLKPAMTLKSVITHIKRVPAGFKVSYGSTYTTENETTIATVPVGYGDGLSRLLSSRGYMLVHGKRAPIVGRVCMDMTMLDVGDIPDLHVEEEVIVFGNQGSETISVDEIARITNTINYEIVTAVTARVPRIYVKKPN